MCDYFSEKDCGLFNYYFKSLRVKNLDTVTYENQNAFLDEVLEKLQNVSRLSPRKELCASYIKMLEFIRDNFCIETVYKNSNSESFNQ